MRVSGPDRTVHTSRHHTTELWVRCCYDGCWHHRMAQWVGRGRHGRPGAAEREAEAEREKRTDSLAAPDYTTSEIVIDTWQWSLGPHSEGSFRAATCTRSARQPDPNTKSNCRVA